MHLIAKPIPQRGESPLALLHRTACANGYRSSRELLNKLDISTSLLGFAENTDVFSKAIAMNENQQSNLLSYHKTRTDKPTYDIQDIHIDRKLVSINNRRTCLHCYEEKHYETYQHDYSLITVCPKHKVQLAEQCSCGQMLNWSGPLLEQCQCGKAIINSPAHKEDIKAQRHIYHWLSLKDQQTISLLEAFFFAFTQFSVLHGNKLSRNRCIRLAVNAILKPESCYIHLKPILTSSALSPRIALYPFLSSKHDTIRLLADKLMASFDVSFTHQYVPNITLNQSEALAILNVSNVQYRELVALGLLSAEKTSKHGSWQVQLSSINKLFCQLSALTNNNRKVKTLSISQILGHPRFHLSLAKIIQLTLTGEYTLNQADFKVGLKSLSYSAIDSPSLFTAIDSDEYLTIKQASKHTRHSESHLRALANTQFLPSVKAKGNSTLKLIKKQDLLAFDSDYVIGPQLATDTGSSPHSLCSKLIAFGIKPVTGPSIDGTTCYLFKREDLAHINFDKIEKITLPHRTNKARLITEPTNSQRSNDYLSFNSVKNKLSIDITMLRRLLGMGLLKKHPDFLHKPYVSKASYDSFVTKLNSKQTVSVDKVITSLGIDDKVFNAKFVLTGQCQPEDLGLTQLISVKAYKHIQQFHDKYLTTAEANNYFPEKNNYVPNLEKRGLLTPTIFTTTTGKRRIKCWVKKAVVTVVNNQPG